MGAQLLIKTAITVALIVSISEVSRRSTLVGGLLASLPLTSLLAIVWLHVDTGDVEQVASLTSAIFWLVLPSLVFFVLFPILLRRDLSFWPAMFASSGATVIAYFVMLRVLRFAGISL